MYWKWLAEHAQAEWRIVTDAPVVFLITVLFVAAALFCVFTWAYQSVIAQKDSAISGQQTTITNLTGTVTNLRGEISDLEKKLAAQPQSNPPAQADPDALFQFGTKVGRGIGAQIDLGQSVVFFAQVLGAGDFNPHADFQFRDLMLHAKQVATSGMAVMAGQRRIQLVNVVCQIVGKKP